MWPKLTHSVQATMTKQEEELLEIIRNLRYGEVIIKKEGGRVVIVKETKSIKLSGGDSKYLGMTPEEFVRRYPIGQDPKLSKEGG